MSRPQHARHLDRPRVMLYMGTQGTLSGLDYHVLTLCEHLDRDRLDVAITCPVEDRNEDLPVRMAGRGITLHRFASEERTRTGYVKRTLGLIRLLRRERVDVLHVHAGGFTGFNAFLAALLARVPVLFVTHHSLFGLSPHSKAGRLSLWLEKRMATRVVALNTGHARDLATIGIPPERIVVVPNGVDLSRFGPAESSPSTVEDGEVPLFRLAIVSRLIEGKGHEEILRALHKLVGRYPQLRLLVVGDGPNRPRIEALVRELGLGGVVELVGQLSNDRVPVLLRSGRVILLPSYMSGETFPNTLLEGTAMGLAAIGTRFAAIPDIIAEGETGLLVEPRDVDGLAEAIEKMVSNPAMTAEMGRKGHLRAKQLFSAEALGRNLTNLYVQAISENRNQKTEIRNQKSRKRDLISDF
jgi:glycosyltransferase involved in cell wall biosynthesis